MDLDALDGYDELEAGEQEKIQRAFEQGHVDDEDWKGVGVLFLASSLSFLWTMSPYYSFISNYTNQSTGCRSEPSRLHGIPQAYL